SVLCTETHTPQPFKSAWHIGQRPNLYFSLDAKGALDPSHRHGFRLIHHRDIRISQTLFSARLFRPQIASRLRPYATTSARSPWVEHRVSAKSEHVPASTPGRLLLSMDQKFQEFPGIARRALFVNQPLPPGTSVVCVFPFERVSNVQPQLSSFTLIRTICHDHLPRSHELGELSAPSRPRHGFCQLFGGQKLLDETIHILHRRAAATGNPLFPASIDDGMIAAFPRSH